MTLKAVKLCNLLSSDRNHLICLMFDFESHQIMLAGLLSYHRNSGNHYIGFSRQITCLKCYVSSCDFSYIYNKLKKRRKEYISIVM